MNNFLDKIFLFIKKIFKPKKKKKQYNDIYPHF